MRTAKPGRTPDDPSRKSPVTSTGSGAPAQRILTLQRTAGNAAVVQLLSGEGAFAAPVQQEHRHGPDCGHLDAVRAAGAAPAVQRSAVHDVLRGSGRPLDDDTRADMESRLGADFSDVRIHTGAAAQASASEIGARAYTSGSHIVLGAGGADRHTLAHELTHVIQQRQGPVAGTDNGSGLRVSDPSDRFEREAEANAARALAGPAPSVQTASAHPAGHDHTGGDSVVQRHKVELQPGPPQTVETQAFDAFFNSVDAAVEWAYLYVTTAPQLGPLADYDGYTKRWVEVWNQFHTSGRSGGISKEFGYAIESIAQARLSSIGGPTLSPGMSYGTQVTFGTTRPDYVLFSQGAPVGAVDITAEGSTGHVLAKTGWDVLFPRFGESVYPSLTSTVTQGMQMAHGNTAALTPQAAEQLRQQAAANRAGWEANWSQMAVSFRLAMQQVGILNADGGVRGGGDPIIREQQRRSAVFSWMTTALGVTEDVAAQNATVMLLKFNPSWPASFYCNDSTASVSRGEAFLTSVFPEWQQRASANGG
ncbi:eCIS core domain-containing protein [Streptomyces sp. YKOK-I1]